jgi:peptidoglycan hydrolase-like protein with peptidoglycan-binding domain
VDAHKKAMAKLLRRGRVETNEEQASHNAAPDDVALRLYGITKWANENDVDLMIHIHLNDTGGHTDTAPGGDSGLAIYVPDAQYGNARASRAIAEPVFARLNAFNATSTLAIEDQGIVEDQELIALGAYNTSEVPSLLIEYGYIYEPKYVDDATRPAVYADLAYQTSRGIEDFFGATTNGKYATTVLPHAFLTDAAATTTVASSTPSVEVYALKAALATLGFYPKAPATLVNCPIDGELNGCVTDAVQAFQASKGLPTTGTLGLATRTALNAFFSPVPVSVPVASAAPASCSFSTALALNSTDAATDGAVTRLQAILAKDAALYPERKVTGFFGPATEGAVKRFQAKNGIAKEGAPGYGTVGPRTGSALCAL